MKAIKSNGFLKNSLWFFLILSMIITLVLFSYITLFLLLLAIFSLIVLYNYVKIVHCIELCEDKGFYLCLRGNEAPVKIILKNRSKWFLINHKVLLFREDYYGKSRFYSGKIEIHGSTVSPGDQISYVFHNKMPDRGNYEVRNLRLIIEDKFNLFRYYRDYSVNIVITVYPYIFPIEQMKFFYKELLPVFKTRYKLIEDMTSITGIRNYRPEDEYKKIHWKATAKTQNLMVKTCQYTADTSLNLFVNMNLTEGLTDKAAWRNSRDRIEEDILIIGLSFFYYLKKKKINSSLTIMDNNKDPQYYDYTLPFEYVFKNIVNTRGSSDKASGISDIVQLSHFRFNLTSTLIFISIYFSDKDFEKIMDLKLKVSQIILIITPFGINSEKKKSMLAHLDLIPEDLRKMEKKISVLKKEGITVIIVEPEFDFTGIVSLINFISE